MGLKPGGGPAMYPPPLECGGPGGGTIPGGGGTPGGPEGGIFSPPGGGNVGGISTPGNIPMACIAWV